MAVESMVIFGIILAVIVISIRKKSKYAITITPLLILPAMNIIAYLFSDKISKLFLHDKFLVYIIINALAVLISGVLIGGFIVKFNTKSSRVSYASMCILFNIILAAIFIAYAI